MKNRWGVVLVLALAAIGALLFALRAEIAVAGLKRLAPRMMAADTIATLPDGLHVALCGTGSPLPDPKRSGPCTAIIAGDRLFVVDAGDGAARTLARMRIPPQRVIAMFLTHFHSDHIDGLGALALQRWAGSGAAAPLPVYGPTGVERVVAGFNEAYTLDSTYRVAHHGADIVPPSGFGMTAQPFQIAGASVVVFEGGGLRVTAFTVDHKPIAPAVGYRFDYKGRSVVISGDTVRSSNLETVANGADVLVHEALAPNLVAILEQSARQSGRTKLAKIFKDIPNYHTSPREVAASATAAGVKAVLLTHIVPAMPTVALEPAFLDGARAGFSGPFWIGRDGDIISLPANGKTVTRRNVL